MSLQLKLFRRENSIIRCKISDRGSVAKLFTRSDQNKRYLLAESYIQFNIFSVWKKKTSESWSSEFIEKQFFLELRNINLYQKRLQSSISIEIFNSTEKRQRFCSQLANKHKPYYLDKQYCSRKKTRNWFQHVSSDSIYSCLLLSVNSRLSSSVFVSIVCVFMYLPVSIV